MAEPWGISGPQFIFVFIAGYAVAWGLAVLLRRVLAPRRVPLGQPPLSEDEFAYLHGGWRRVVDTAIARLISAKRLRITRAGNLAVVSGSRTTRLADAQEQIVFDAVVSTHSRQRTLFHVRRAAKNRPETKAVRDSLAARGLVVAGYWLWLLTGLPVLAVEVTGIVRLVNGIRLERPTDFLFFLVVLGAALLALVALPAKPWLTSAGRDTRAAARGGSRGRDIPLPVLGRAAAAVAVGGLTAYPDAAIASSFRSGSGSGGDSGSSSGSSCGGGGGGCGG